MENKQRDQSLDLFKGFLIIQMTLAHVLAFYGNGNKTWYWVSQCINLSTFGGFLLAFGWGAQLAWFGKDPLKAKPRMWMAALRLQIAFVVSAMLYLTLVQGRYFEPQRYFEVAIFMDTPNYSQFLGSFTVTTLIGVLFYGFWRGVSTKLAIILALLMILSTLLPKVHNIIPIAYLWTPQTLGTFPVLQYGHYWIVGLLLARSQLFKDWKLGILALLLSLPTLIYAIIHQHMPQEYGPSIFWICGAYFIHWIYLRLSLSFNQYSFTQPIAEMGSKALYYLIGTNLMIFSLRGHLPSGQSLGFCFCVTIGILAFLSWFAHLAKRS